MKHKHPLMGAGLATAMAVGIGGAVFAQSAPQKTGQAAETATARTALPPGSQEYAREDYEASSDTVSTLPPGKLEWFRDAHFGMFIHWGLYSVAGGTWEGKRGQFIMDDFKVPVKSYEKLAAQFNPTKFDADAWVKAAHDAGMKYICFTSKHHEGFAMYESKVSPYNIVDATPWHHDPVKDLAVACQKYGVKLCLYYSQSLDWHEPDGLGNTWDFGPNEKKDFEHYLQTKALPQVKEILTQYGPIGMIWFDVPDRITKTQSKAFRNLVRTLQPDCLINGRLGNGVGDYNSMGDSFIPNRIEPGAWESCMTINHTWGYSVHNTQYESVRTLLHQLVDITSKGGNYLLNVGPMGDGMIPQPQLDQLAAIGRWMKVNGESIHGTRPAAFKFPQWGRVTMKPGTLYLHVLAWPADGKLVLDGLTNPITKASLLADPEHKALKASVDGGVLAVQLPGTAPDPDDSVVAVEYTGDLKIEPHPFRQTDDGSLTLDIANSDYNQYFGAREFVWNVDVTKPGKYQVAIAYTSHTAEHLLKKEGFNGGFPVKFGAENGAPLPGELAPAATRMGHYPPVPIGTVDLPTAGVTKLRLSPGGDAKAFSKHVLFKKIELKPVE